MSKELKIRCSEIGKIMVGASLDPLPLTELQNKTLSELLSKIKLTEKQSETRDLLIKKRDELPILKLSVGAKTYIEQLWYENKFDFKKSFTNKYVQKGNSIESHSLSELSKFLGVKCFKNIKFFENDFVKGTPDSLLKQFKSTIDAKNVYYPDGLNFFKSDHAELGLYIWQIHAYNFLLGHETGYIIRMLMNPPQDIIEKEIYSAWKGLNNSFDELPNEEFRNKITEKFNFEQKLSFDERINFVKIESNKKHFELIEKMVSLARIYYEELNEKFMNRKLLLIN